MKKINVRALLKVMKPEEIIEAYMSGRIYITQKQLQFVIDKKDKVGRGSAVIGIKKEVNYERIKKNK